MMNLPMMIRHGNAIRGFAKLINIIDNPLKDSRTNFHVGYGNIRVHTETISEKSAWLDKVEHKPGYVPAMGSLKKY